MTVTLSHSHYDSIPKQKKDIMEVIGDKGRWQWQIFFQMFFILALSALHNLSMTFLAPNQDHWCSRTFEAANLSIPEWKRTGLPLHDQQCSRYESANISGLLEYQNNRSSIRIIPCSSWEYDEAFYSSTLLSKWNLVCKSKWLVSASKSSFMVGILLSAIIFGHLADRFGRKYVIVVASIINSVFSILCPFSTSIVMFIVFRFFLAIGIGGYYDTAFILLMEVVVPEKRPMYCMSVQTGWCFGFICLPGVVWLIRDAFWIQITLSALTFLLAISSVSIPESPRWLLSKGKVEDARRFLIEAAKANKISSPGIEMAIDEVIAKSKKDYESKKTDKNLMDLLRMPSLRRTTLFLFFIWFINSFIYFGLSFNTNELSGNPFANFALSGAIEFPACFLSIFVIRSLGRKRPLSASMIIGGIICLILYLIPQDTSQTVVAAAMIGKFAITCSFGILYVFTAELFPTVVRNIGLGWSTVFEGVASILAPFIRELGYATHPAVPQFLFGVLSIVGGALVVFLPETNNLVVPDTLEDAATPRLKEANSDILKIKNTVLPNSKE